MAAPAPPPLTRERLIADVERRIDQALEENRRRERVVTGLLVALFVSGIGLLVYAAAVRYWPLLFAGLFLNVLVIWPIQRMIELRSEALRLQIVPQMLRLANTRDQKELAVLLTRKLIQQIGAP